MKDVILTLTNSGGEVFYSSGARAGGNGPREIWTKVRKAAKRYDLDTATLRAAKLARETVGTVGIQVAATGRLLAGS